MGVIRQRNLSYGILGLLLLVSCSTTNQPEDSIVMIVGERTVTGREFRRDMDRLMNSFGVSDKDLQSFLDPLLEEVIESYLILEYGRENGITLPESEMAAAIREIQKDYPEGAFNEVLLLNYVDYDEWKEELRTQIHVQKIVKSVLNRISPVRFDEVKGYFESHGEEFQRPQMVKFRQIVTRTREGAEKVLDRLSKGENFEAMAMEHSATTERRIEGDTGWIARGQLEEGMEKAIFSLSPGQKSSIVRTPYGYHVFMVLDRRQGGLRSLPEVMEEIQQRLASEKQEAFFRDWLEGLKRHFPVRIDHEVIRTLGLGSRGDGHRTDRTEEGS
jgi:parvulin-like peptidyl-prolyl isomerase